MCHTTSVLDPLKLYSEEIREFLPASEPPLACITAAYFPGREVASTPSSGEGDTIDPGGVRTEAERGWSINVFDASLSIHAWDAAVEKLIAGTSLMGAPGSLARTLSTDITPTADLLLTNRRLIVVDNLRQSGRTTSLVWSCTVDEIAAMSRIPRGVLQRGRIGIVFRDRSSIALVAGTITNGKAKQLVNAFNTLTHRR